MVRPWSSGERGVPVEIAYKIVQVWTPSYTRAKIDSTDVMMVSFCANTLRQVNAVARYHLNRTTRPPVKGSKLFVYADLDVAKFNFRFQRMSTILLACECTGLVPFKERRVPMADNARIVWKEGVLDTKMAVPSLAAISGTCLADTVKPIGIVDWCIQGVLSKGECPWLKAGVTWR